MLSQEEYLVMINEFLEKTDRLLLVIALTPQSQLYPSTSFPTSSKTKASCTTECITLSLHLSLFLGVFGLGCVFCQEES